MTAIQKAREALDDDTDFRLGDIVETIKGANFWGEIIAFDNDGNSAGCTVLAIAPGFEGTKHVYPLKQIRRRALDAETEAKIKPLVWSSSWSVIKAESPIGHYFIAARRDGGFDCRLEEHWNTWASSEESAKSAAQADFERRIRSALVPPEARP